MKYEGNNKWKKKKLYRETGNKKKKKKNKRKKKKKTITTHESRSNTFFSRLFLCIYLFNHINIRHWRWRHTTKTGTNFFFFPPFIFNYSNEIVVGGGGRVGEKEEEKQLKTVPFDRKIPIIIIYDFFFSFCLQSERNRLDMDRFMYDGHAMKRPFCNAFTGLNNIIIIIIF